VFYHEYWSHKEGKKVVGPYRSRIHMLRSLCRKAKVKEFGFHALRHASSSILANENVPLITISKLLGHSSRLTTEIYLHSIGESERAAMDVFEKARSNSTDPTNLTLQEDEDERTK
jgi:integrase